MHINQHCNRTTDIETINEDTRGKELPLSRNIGQEKEGKIEAGLTLKHKRKIKFIFKAVTLNITENSKTENIMIRIRQPTKTQLLLPT